MTRDIAYLQLNETWFTSVGDLPDFANTTRALTLKCQVCPSISTFATIPPLGRSTVEATMQSLPSAYNTKQRDLSRT